MNPLVKALALALALPLAFTESARAVTVLIDFGRTTNLTTGYNNVGTTTPVALVDTGAVATGWTVTMANTGNGGFGQAGAGADVPTFPAAVSAFAPTALQDSLFANAGTGTASMTVTLTGLSQTSTFDLLFYGSRNNLQNISQTWTLTQGMSATPVNHNSLLNDTVVVDWKNVAPTAGGVIEITLSGPPTTAGALALNFGSITEVVPEPSSVFLLGLSGLALLARRRR